ncbi:hypothetical protein SUGI_0629700 [Cryptomeria japonica]|uniref:small heat shock protein, chloroplastic n=1 Tax=Cryptomeria japonica TaxID=3369 RepID=UPI0024149EEC|nr:small heat shock protein, chloroplastic [Cryptomeria japonica]GLJ31380.1 hypothetical protein SUGI_0629700 [Cryptomeria japonica]
MAGRLLAKKLVDQTLLTRLRGGVTSLASQGRNFSTSAVATQNEDKNVAERPRRRRRSPMLRRWADLIPLGFSDLSDPFPVNRTLNQMMDTVNRLFDEFAPSRTAGEALENFRPAYDIMEENDSYKLRFDMPGLSKEDVKVEIEDGTLVIKGEHSQEEREKNWSSRSFGSYNTRIILPENVRLDEVKAEMKNGVLQVTVPKTEPEKKQDVIAVNIN